MEISSVKKGLFGCGAPLFSCFLDTADRDGSIVDMDDRDICSEKKKLQVLALMSVTTGTGKYLIDSVMTDAGNCNYKANVSPPPVASICHSLSVAFIADRTQIVVVL